MPHNSSQRRMACAPARIIGPMPAQIIRPIRAGSPTTLRDQSESVGAAGVVFAQSRLAGGAFLQSDVHRLRGRTGAVRRAQGCAYEFKTLRYAVKREIGPHLDRLASRDAWKLAPVTEAVAAAAP